MVMKSAYASSGKIFEQVSMRTNPGLIEQLKAVKPSDLIVVRGTYDHIEKLLDTLHVPYTLIGRDEIEKQNGGRVMFVNCMDYSNKAPVRPVQNFVEGGGRLVTTDWAVGLLAKAFPGKLTKTKDTSDDVVEVRAENDIARRFLGMNYAQCHPKWWLEGASHIYKAGGGVTTLFSSEEMKSKYGQSPVAVAFPHGRGEVFHFISHLELQRTKQKSASDKGTLDDFLKKMDAVKTGDMDASLTVAELEAAYSTLNTLANLCTPLPIINSGSNSYLLKSAKAPASEKSKKLV
ncbi:MAG TPA: hypothetical protein VJ461_02095 [Candidatus Nanoarchaeia archaeon]|nr:hypothetical protein [Candidatus Nanoarchaeia archaeon]